MGMEMGLGSGIIVRRGMEVGIGLVVGGCVDGIDVGIGCESGGICEVDGMDYDVVGRGLEIGVDS